jgi:hypothetical protein
MENNWRADVPITEKVVWTAVTVAAKCADIAKRVSPHTLRQNIPDKSSVQIDTNVIRLPAPAASVSDSAITRCVIDSEG